MSIICKMIKKKLYKKLLIVLSSLLLVSCGSSSMPEGDIKDFIDSFEYEKTEKSTQSGSCYFKQVDYDGEEILGSSEYEISFSWNSNSLYYKKNATYVGNYIENNLKTYFEEDSCDENNNLSSIIKENGEIKDPLTMKDSIKENIRSYFYTENQSGYHMYGKYYGDNLIINATDYYNNFSLNNDKTLLTYNLENDLTKKDYIINNIFVVDTYGMLVSSNMEVKSLTNSGYKISTTFNAQYVYSEN